MKSIKKIFLIFIVGTIMGISFNILAFLCSDTLIHKNVLKSIETFRVEGAFPMTLPSYMSTRLDNNSDAWMMLMADYADTQKSIFEKAVGGFYKIYSEDSNLLGQASLIAMEEPVRELDGEYARYWHGWILPLRILLMFFSYDDIRFIGMALQYCLIVCMFLLMQKKEILNYGVGLFVMLMFICPIVSCISLEYTFIFYISTISSIFILSFHKKLVEKKLYMYVFLLIGMSTSYFDFLTYPVVALGMPLLFLLILLQEDMINCKRKIQYTICCSVMWGIGYIGFWGIKWIIASLILKKNIIMNAYHDIMIRSGNVSYDGSLLSYTDVINSNVEILIHRAIIMLFIATLIGIFYKKIYVKKELTIDIASSIPFLLVMGYPFIWYFFTKNHSYIHYHFAYRNLSVSVFAFYCLPEVVFSRKSRKG